MTVEDCELIELPTISDRRGKLTVVEGGDHIPFDIRRIYYLYDVPEGILRGAHAHKALRQVMIAMSGNLEIVLDDGTDQRRFKLNRPDRGLLVGSMVWRSLESFSASAVCCVLASAPHLESDYIRDYDEFVNLVRAR